MTEPMKTDDKPQTKSVDGFVGKEVVSGHTGRCYSVDMLLGTEFGNVTLYECHDKSTENPKTQAKGIPLLLKVVSLPKNDKPIPDTGQLFRNVQTAVMSHPESHIAFLCDYWCSRKIEDIGCWLFTGYWLFYVTEPGNDGTLDDYVTRLCTSECTTGQPKRNDWVNAISNLYTRNDFGIEVARQLSNALSTMSHYGICHGYLNPSSIRITMIPNKPYFTLRVTDIGVTGYFDRTVQYMSEYVAPELQCNYGFITSDSIISDVWSCGMILYNIFVGKFHESFSLRGTVRLWEYSRTIERIDVRATLGKTGEQTIPGYIFDLLDSMLTRNVDLRLTPEQFFAHHIFERENKRGSVYMGPTIYCHCRKCDMINPTKMRYFCMFSHPSSPGVDIPVVFVDSKNPETVDQIELKEAVCLCDDKHVGKPRYTKRCGRTVDTPGLVSCNSTDVTLLWTMIDNVHNTRCVRCNMVKTPLVAFSIGCLDKSHLLCVGCFSELGGTTCPICSAQIEEPIILELRNTRYKARTVDTENDTWDRRMVYAAKAFFTRVSKESNGDIQYDKNLSERMIRELRLPSEEHALKLYNLAKVTADTDITEETLTKIRSVTHDLSHIARCLDPFTTYDELAYIATKAVQLELNVSFDRAALLWSIYVASGR